MWIIQAGIYTIVSSESIALIAHIIFHPYLSGRQSRLELWSLVVITITLCVTLFLPTLTSDDVAAYVLSFLVLFLNLFVILGNSCSLSFNYI